LKNEVRLDGQRIENKFNRFSSFNEEVSSFINDEGSVYGTPTMNQYPYEKFYWENKKNL